MVCAEPTWARISTRHGLCATYTATAPEAVRTLNAMTTRHVLFNWHAPELWRRFTIALRRAVAAHLRCVGLDPGVLRVSFVKVAEYQRRAVVHYHTLIRLDPTDNDAKTNAKPEPVIGRGASHACAPSRQSGTAPCDTGQPRR